MDQLVPVPKKRKKKDEPGIQLQRFQGTKEERLRQLWEQQWYGCKRCILSTFRRDPNGNQIEDICFADGNPDAKIMIIGEAPGVEEEASSIPFVGASGRLLNQILAAVSDDPGIQELYHWYNHKRKTKEDMDYFHEKMFEWRRREFFITNVVACRPPDNRTPSNPEVAACSERLYNIIHIVDPWLIITLGRPAIEALIHKKIEVTKKRGDLFEIEMPGLVTKYKKEVLACLHPSYLLRNADWNNKTGTYMKTLKDFRWAMTYVDHMKLRYLGTPLPERKKL